MNINDFLKEIKNFKSIRPMKIGVEIINGRGRIFGFNAKTFSDLNASFEAEGVIHDNLYAEYYFNDILEIIKKEIVINSINPENGIVSFINISSKEEGTIESLGNISRHKSFISKIMDNEIEDYHYINIENMEINTYFKAFTASNKEILEKDEFGARFIDIGGTDYFMSTNNFVMQIMKLFFFSHTPVGNPSTPVSNYKFPQIIRKLTTINSPEALFVAENKHYVIYGTDRGYTIYAPKETFKFSISNNHFFSDFIEKNMDTSNKISIKLTDKEILREFFEDAGEDIFIKIENNQVKIRSNIHHNYFKAINSMSLIKNDLKKDTEFPVKRDTIRDIMNNPNISYLTLNNYNSSVIMTDNKDLRSSYHMYMFRTSNSF